MTLDDVKELIKNDSGTFLQYIQLNIFIKSTKQNDPTIIKMWLY